MKWTILAAAAFSLTTAPVSAQTAPPAPPSDEGQRSGMEGEATGYLAVAGLLVLTIIVGFLLGGGETPESP